MLLTTQTCTTDTDHALGSNPIPCNQLNNKLNTTVISNTYYPAGYVSNLPPQLKTREVTATAHASNPPYQSNSETRTTAYDYYTDTGTLKSQTVEPNTSLALTNTITYTAQGQPKTITVSGPGITSHTTTHIYETTVPHRLVETRNPLNQSEQYAYEDARFPWLRTRLTGPNGLSTQWHYDIFGWQYKETRADGTSTVTTRYWCGQCQPLESHYTVTTQSGATPLYQFYDSLGRLVRTTQERYASNGVLRNQITRKTYNEKGQLVWESDPYFEGDPVYGTTMAYDALGRPVQITAPDGSVSAIAYQGQITQFTDANSHTKTEIKNALGQVVQTIDALGSSVTYDYDAFGHLVQTTDPAGHQIKSQYDLRGNKIKTSDPDQGVWTYAYNALGQLIAQTDAKGQTTALTYDLLGRRVTRTSSSGTSTWTYDQGSHAVGKLTAVTNGDGYTQTYSYDQLGRPSNQTTAINGMSYPESFVYDSFSRVIQFASSGVSIKHAYHAQTGDLIQVADPTTEQVYWNLKEKTARGQVSQYQLGNGQITTRYFDPQTGRLDTLQSQKAGIYAQNMHFTFDVLGNLQDRWDDLQGLHEWYSYDSLNRLTDTYTQTNLGFTHATVTYDALGNITHKSGVGDYTYHSAHPHAVSQISGQKNTTYAYDANGNMISGDGRNLTYNDHNQLVSIQASSGTTHFQYAPDGARYQRIDLAGQPGQTTTTYLGKHYEKIERSSGTTHKYYLGDYAVITKQDNASGQTVDYLHRDHLGSIVAITDSQGNVKEQLAYDPWGQRRLANWEPMTNFLDYVGTVTNRGFTGHEHIDASGLIHMNGRVYDPVIGRFLSADPMVQAPYNLQSLNRYSYVLNNPLALVDPSGYSWLSRGWKRMKKSLENRWLQVRAVLKIAGAVVAGVGCAANFAPACLAIPNLLESSRNDFHNYNRKKRGLPPDRSAWDNTQIGFNISFDPVLSGVQRNNRSTHGMSPPVFERAAYKAEGGSDWLQYAMACNGSPSCGVVMPAQKGNGVIGYDDDGVPIFDESHPMFHSYYGSNSCLKTSSGCTYANGKGGLLRFPAPGAYGEPIVDEQTGFAIPVGTVRHEVYDGGAQIINVTLEGKHLLHPGIVRRWVTQDALSVTIHTYGEGTGPLPGPNEFFSESLWRRVDSNIFDYMSQQ